MNNTPNPLFAKFDQALGVTKPTSSTFTPSRADEIRSLAKPQQPENTSLSGPAYIGKVANNLGDTFTQGGQNVINDIKNEPTLAAPQHTTDALGDIGMNAARNTLAVGATAGHVAGDIAGTAGGIIGSLIEPVLPDGVKQKLGDVGTYLNQKMTEAGIPQEVQKSLGDVFNTISLLGGEKATPTVKEGLTQGAKTVENLASKTKDAIVGTPEAKAAAQAAKDAQIQSDLQSSAIKDATPSYSKKMIGEAPVKTPTGESVPRVQEGGGLVKGRTITPTSLESEAGAELSKVKGYDPKATSLEKYNLIQPELKTRAQALNSSLEKENILRPPKEVTKVVNDAVKQASEESLLLSKTDPVLKNYMRVVKNAVSKADGTLAGELKVRQLMDQAYSNARGKMAFGSDKIAPLDELHSAGRDALNQDIIDHARSTDVKASLRSQWNLNRAADVLRDKAELEGNSTIEQLMKKYPITSKITKSAVKAAGLGAGLHLVP